MTSLQVRGSDLSVSKQKAVEDAKRMQAAVAEQCTKSGKEPPPYQLNELIGKGSFGRVYKATSLKNNQLVAVKAIDIDEGDTMDPKLADTYSDLLKEINALQLLSDSGARNINLVIEALPVGQAMWIITEYCAGGSVATLMKPTAPGGLLEKWIIPILREVAEAIYWVHGQGIIHRDLKCANILVTETGNVQLCDFGVAGIVETKFDKRSTFIGTLHWMAPEIFDPGASYGTEVDIWAFGAMAYEMASGVPPNASMGMDISKLTSNLKQRAPRLEGDRYSTGLKDLIAYCLQLDPKKRPTIEMVQRHPYLFKSEETYPTSSLQHLVRAFKLWEAQGGDRRSLFSSGGAQGPSDISLDAFAATDDWNFSTTAAFDQQVFNNGDAQDVFDVYGSNVDFDQRMLEETSRPQKPKFRRGPPPQLLKPPLEKLFDPNTISNYEDNSRAYYGRPFQMPSSDLPLRDESQPFSDVRESLIDLDVSLGGSEFSQFFDMNTIRLDSRQSHESSEYDLGESTPYLNPPLSDPADLNNHRRTQDWKFPVVPPPASANPEMSRFPFNEENLTLEPNSRPTLLHTQTEPVQPVAAHNDLTVPKSMSMDNRTSVGSLIDLDMSFADTSTDYTRPSTSHSDVGSISGSDVGGVNPFELEKHASLYMIPTSNREPSIYVSDDSEYATSFAELHTNDDARPEEHEGMNGYVSGDSRPYSLSEFADMDPEMTPFTPQQTTTSHHRLTGSFQEPPPLTLTQPTPESEYPMPALPPAPSARVMQGQASNEEVKEELWRLAMSLGDHLAHINTQISTFPARRGSAARIESLREVL